MTYNLTFGAKMAKAYNEQSDLDLVSAYLGSRGLSAERFSAEETRTGRTPDFRLNSRAS
jgi:hypothetical protein